MKQNNLQISIQKEFCKKWFHIEKWILEKIFQFPEYCEKSQMRFYSPLSLRLYVKGIDLYWDISEKNFVIQLELTYFSIKLCSYGISCLMDKFHKLGYRVGIHYHEKKKILYFIDRPYRAFLKFSIPIIESSL
jgi:hypothetical protein